MEDTKSWFLIEEEISTILGASSASASGEGANRKKKKGGTGGNEGYNGL